MDIRQIETRFKVTDDQIEKWAAACEKGDYPGDAVGDVVIGRPLMFGGELKPVTFKETKQKIAAMDKKAASLGQSRSDYLRNLVDRDLAAL
jgi:hypothetical protein